MNDVTMRLGVDELILAALREDVPGEDVTTNAVMPTRRLGEVDLICKQDGVVAGLEVFRRTFELLDSATQATFGVVDGDEVASGTVVGTVRGDMRVLLTGERVALNFLQRMSGIATYTRGVARLLEGTSTRLLDTRKTTPGLRVLEKYAVRVGGGHNHRFNLSDGVLLKDNHIAAAGGVARAVRLAREYAPFVRKIEVEVEDLAMLQEALDAGADIVMLDNMGVDQMRAAVQMAAGRAQTECSGNVTRENVACLVELGVDFVSCGALTHSAPALDFSLKNLRALVPRADGEGEGA